MKKSYFSHGKLLLTAEYLVLDGAKAIALPTNKGQQMTVDILPGSGNIYWTAKDLNGNIWLNFSFILQELHLIPIAMGTLDTSPEVIILKNIFENALAINPHFLNNQADYEIITHLQFPNKWGLGSSSTLIANIAKWAEIDAMKLFFNSMEGSGYDVAVAMEAQPIIYHLETEKPVWEVVNFKPSFTNGLFFVHLGIKQNSRNEIANYKTLPKPTSVQIEQINTITQQIFECNNLQSFEKLITEHETILAQIVKIEPVKNRWFKDYPGAIKSLGAWGGDFILVTGNEAKIYFKKKGFDTVLSWDEMVKI